jgi:PAS domain S-box-containing protein
MPVNNRSTWVAGTAPEVAKQVEERFGVLPNFVRLAPEIPEITEKFWGFAQAAYLDNPPPSLFKERLFVHLSRFCTVRYCLARHVGFLAGLGRPSGDAQARVLRIDEIVQLLRRRVPRGEELEKRFSLCSTLRSPLPEMPPADSLVEELVFAFASHVFLQTPDAPACLNALERLLGAEKLQCLLMFLTFVRAVHYWTGVHPELQLEDDIQQLLASNEALAACILNDPEAGSDSLTSLLDELRQKAGRASALLAAIVDSSDDAIVSKTLDGIITSWNSGAEQLFGYTAAEAIGRHISLIIPSDRAQEEEIILERLRRGKRIEHFDTVRLRKDGTTVDVSLTISPVRDASGNIIGASKIARDVTHRRAVERSLRESEDRFRELAGALETQVQFRTQELQRRNAEVVQQSEQLRELSRRLLKTQDEERRRIARDLHDSAGQTLVVLSMNLARIARAVKRDPADLAKSVEDAQAIVQQLTQEIRTTSYLLHPPLLEESGLSSALNWFVQGLKDRSGLDVDLTFSDDLGRLRPEIELVVFRLVQEALANVHRHSASKTARITIGREAGKVHVEIEDRGKGIPPERLSEILSHSAGVGITGMRERVREFGGELTIDSNGNGTRVSATLMCPPSPPDP